MSQTLTAHVVVHPELVTPERLAALQAKLNDFSPVLESPVGQIIEDEIEENFETRGHGSWAPLKEATIREKFRLGYDATPLVRSGKLFRGLTQRDAPGHKFLLSSRGIIVGVYGNVVPYASRLAAGDPARRLPPRILIQVRPGAVDRILTAIKDWLGGQGVTVYADAPLSR